MGEQSAERISAERPCRQLSAGTDGYKAQKHNSQYQLIEVHVCKKCHDRFLIIDGTDVWHIGASLKDLGKKMFAFSRLDIPATAITALM